MKICEFFNERSIVKYNYGNIKYTSVSTKPELRLRPYSILPSSKCRINSRKNNILGK